MNSISSGTSKRIWVQPESSEACLCPWIWTVIRCIRSECCWSTLGKRGEKREFSTGIGMEGIGSLAAGGLCQWHAESHLPWPFLSSASAGRFLISAARGVGPHNQASCGDFFHLGFSKGSPECGNDIVLCFLNSGDKFLHHYSINHILWLFRAVPQPPPEGVEEPRNKRGKGRSFSSASSDSVLWGV